MEAFPWEPPDHVCLEDLQVGGVGGLEIAGREGDDHAHGGAPASCSGLEVEGAGPPSQEVQLDLGLTDITKYFSYSKLWRTLYFVNDAPFCIHYPGCNGNWHPVQRCNGSRCIIIVPELSIL